MTKKPPTKTKQKSLPAHPVTELLHQDFFMLQEERDFSRWLSKDTAVLDYYAGLPEKVPQALWIPLESFRLKKGRKFFSELLYALTHRQFPADQANELWENIIDHKKALAKKLNRPLSIKVAALDYFENHPSPATDLQLYPGEALDHLLFFANEDGLSSLYNHRYFQERLQYEIHRATRYGHNLSLLFIDLDYFKKYNDSFGHLQGDALIREISVFLKNHCRQTDIVARYGGDEFAVILPETKSRQAWEAAKRLQERFKSIRCKISSGGKKFHLSLSLGISTFPQEARTALELTAAADRALYHAKHQGRNCIVAKKRIFKFSGS